MRKRVGTRARIALIDDDPVLTKLVETLLVEEGFDLIVCSRWQESHDFVLREKPDLVLLDLRLGEDASGWRVLDHLALDPATLRIPVILCSGARQSPAAAAPALLPQHNTFVITRPFDLETLLDTIDRALGAYPRLLRLNAGHLPRDCRSDAGVARLTPRELEIAQLIARGYSNRQIADALVITQGTVANHVGQILDKLGCSSRVQVAIMVMSSHAIESAEHEDGPASALA